MSIDALKAQDAFHYALAAAGIENSFFDGRSRSSFLRDAIRTAKEAGLSLRAIRTSRLTVKGCVALVTVIREECLEDGVVAETGTRVR